MQSLHYLLDKYNIDSTLWLKPITSLYDEVIEGKCKIFIQNNMLVRTVNLVNITCYRIMDDIKIKIYDTMDVIIGSENPFDATIRCLNMLGLTVIYLNITNKETRKCNSVSYCGLYTIYTIYSMECLV